MTDIQVPVTGEPLSMEQFASIMAEIEEHHGFYVIKPGSRMIKYVRPSFDTRDMKCFHIRLSTFSSTNETEFSWTDSERPMYERICAWLRGVEVQK